MARFEDSPTTPQALQGLRSIPRSIWALGFVSMSMDISSEMIHSLLPVFLVSVLGASATALGVLEGVAEATVNVFKIFSGMLSDWLGKRKPLALLGYGLAALTKPVFPLANSFSIVFAARLTDRIGKGVRGAPRDALVADLTPPHLRGASYGLRQSLDTVGAFTGPLAAVFLMLAFEGDFRSVFWVAVLPAFVSVALLAFFVHEPSDSRTQHKARRPLRWQELRYFPSIFWFVVAVGAIFTLARFSEAFLILRANSLGLDNAYVPLVLVVMNAIYAVSSYPAGHLSDRIDRRFILAVSGVALIAADVVLATATGTASLMVGISLWGLHMGFSQGLLTALVADTAPVRRRGTAFGLFNLVSGVVLLVASVVAGALWDRIGAAATFYAGASFAGIALLGLLLHIKITPAIARPAISA
ncbi:MAG: MFS transporter [Acidobacteria bacterium]|nr:MFS transporter [Acidobacteriota bacterium]